MVWNPTIISPRSAYASVYTQPQVVPSLGGQNAGFGYIRKDLVSQTEEFALIRLVVQSHAENFKQKSGKTGCISTGMSWQKYEGQVSLG